MTDQRLTSVMNKIRLKIKKPSLLIYACILVHNKNNNNNNNNNIITLSQMSLLPLQQYEASRRVSQSWDKEEGPND